MLMGIALAGASLAGFGAPLPDALVRPSGRIVAAPGGGWLATWPGVSWSLRFEGQALGVRLDDALNHWVLEIDGEPRLQIAPATGPRTVWLRELPPGEHRAQLIKRTESPQQAARVLGFELEEGARALPLPPAPTQRIEFIGDSYTAAMGNISPGRSCTGAEIGERTDISRGYAVIAARALGAEWQIHAKSGMGLVRNWNGGVPHETHGTHYARALQTDPASRPAADWRPQTVIIGLGTNDFSTPVRPEEPRDAERLERDATQALRELLADVRARHGEPRIVLLTVPLPRTGDLQRAMVARVLAEERAAGRLRITSLDWGTLSAQGCGSHPDEQDHRRMAERLLHTLKDLP